MAQRSLPSYSAMPNLSGGTRGKQTAMVIVGRKTAINDVPVSVITKFNRIAEWALAPLHRLTENGELIWVYNGSPRTKNIPHVLSFGQLNFYLQVAWNKMSEFRKKARPRDPVEGKIYDQVQEYTKEGPAWFLNRASRADGSFNGDNFTSEVSRFFALLSTYSIMATYKMSGIRKNSSVTGPAGKAVFDVQLNSISLEHRGLATITPYWENAGYCDVLYLILKQPRYDQAFQFIPHVGTPTVQDLMYESINGSIEMGVALKIGMVNAPLLRQISTDDANACAGIGPDEVEKINLAVRGAGLIRIDWDARYAFYNVI
jgi:hypothetical protein